MSGRWFCSWGDRCLLLEPDVDGIPVGFPPGGGGHFPSGGGPGGRDPLGGCAGGPPLKLPDFIHGGRQSSVLVLLVLLVEDSVLSAPSRHGEGAWGRRLVGVGWPVRRAALRRASRQPGARLRQLRPAADVAGCSRGLDMAVLLIFLALIASSAANAFAAHCWPN